MSANPRVSKTINNQTTYFIYDGYKLIGEYNQDGEPIKEYLYLNNTPIAIITPTNIYKIYSDHLNTPRQVATQDNTIIWSWESKPFGEDKPNEDVDKDGKIFKLNLRFPGQYFDKETNKHYNINRDYDPITGRYIQSDPIGFDGGVNTYLYVGANPIVRVDESGEKIEYNDEYSKIIAKVTQTKIGRKILHRLSSSDITYKIIDTGRFSSVNEYDPYNHTINMAVDATASIRVYDPTGIIFKTKCKKIYADNILVHELGHAYLQDIGDYRYKDEMYVIKNFENVYGKYERVDHSTCILFWWLKKLLDIYYH